MALPALLELMQALLLPEALPAAPLELALMLLLPLLLPSWPLEEAQREGEAELLGLTDVLPLERVLLLPLAQKLAEAEALPAGPLALALTVPLTLPLTRATEAEAHSETEGEGLKLP